MPDSFQAANCSWPVAVRGCGLPNGSVRSIGVHRSIRGKSTSSSSNAEYHGCDLQTGATSIREALSSLTFLTHLPIKQKGGKAYPSHLFQGSCRASAPTESGPGLQLANCSNWALRWVANRSMLQLPRYFRICWNIGLCNCHSTVDWITLDSLSATQLSTPGRCSAVVDRFLYKHHCHSWITRLLNTGERVPPFGSHRTLLPCCPSSDGYGCSSCPWRMLSHQTRLQGVPDNWCDSSALSETRVLRFISSGRLLPSPALRHGEVGFPCWYTLLVQQIPPDWPPI